jgi:hypothetical protein
VALFKDRDSRRELSSRRASSFSGRLPHLFCRTPLAKSLRFETLEDRRMLAALTVDTDQDIVDFNDGVTSLREAIFAANTVPGADEIVFDLGDGPKTIFLTQGELKITDSLTITGSGAELLTIDASGIQDVNVSSIFNIGGQTSALIYVSIEGLTLTGAKNSAIRNFDDLALMSMVIRGNTGRSGAGILSGDSSFTPRTMSLTVLDSLITQNTAGYEGGGIRFVGADGNLTITRTVIEANSAPTGGGIRTFNGGDGSTRLEQVTLSNNTATNYGGGIHSGYGNVEIVESLITGNQAALGGGISRTDYNLDRMTIESSTISNNTASDGGGVYANGTLIVSASSFLDNSATREGGGIATNSALISGSTFTSNLAGGSGGAIIARAGGGTSAITNSTFSVNRAGQSGGAISSTGSLFLRHSTVVDNVANSNGDEEGTGGAIRLGFRAPIQFEIENSIVAGNRVGDNVNELSLGSTVTLSAHYSLIGTKAGTNLAEAPIGSPDASGNIIGGVIHGVIDPMLGPLADNGGPTKTHALLPGSPAINAGDPTAVASANGVPEFDQRGEPFTRVFGGRIDIGAFEAQSLIVDTLVDENDGDYSEGDFSLREAIALANQIAGANTIEFDPSLAGGTILLTTGELVITDSVEIVGLGAEELTIDAQQQSRILNVTAPQMDVTLSGMTFKSGRTNGNGSEFGGGAIRFRGLNLNVEDCRLTENGTIGTNASGGAIYVDGGFLTMTRSLVSNNSTLGNNAPGGGIVLAFNPASGVGLATIHDCQIIGNSTLGDNSGGGGLTASDAVISNSLFENNQTFGSNSSGGSAFATSSRPDWTITGSTFSDNKTFGVGAQGGAITSNSGLTIVDSHFLSNATYSSTSGGGALRITGNWASTIITSSFIGNIASGGSGGAIASSGRGLTITDCVLTDNQAFLGGAIAGSALTITRSKISNNEAIGQYAAGGGIYVEGGITITQSEVSGNTVIGNVGSGGGIYVRSTSYITISSSTISSNSIVGASGRGGGLYLGYNDAIIVSSTISGNQLMGIGDGAGIFSTKELTVQYSTISNNRIGNELSRGAGMSISAVSKISHSIIAANFAGTSASDIRVPNNGQPTLRFSLLGSNAGTGLNPAPVGSPDANGNLIGTASNPINPMLGPLADNGGPTNTHALLTGSPAINAGDPNLVLGHNDVPEFDQRGAPFARIRLARGANGRIDIGAYESQPSQGSFIADFDLDGDVDGRDYLIWQRGFGMSGPNVTRQNGDATGDGDVDANDLAVWQATYGKDPAPDPMAFVIAGDEEDWPADTWITSLAVPVQSVAPRNPGMEVVDAAFEDSVLESTTPPAILSAEREDIPSPSRLATHANGDRESWFAELGEWRAVGSKTLDFRWRMPR